jgi:hypothetical protein
LRNISQAMVICVLERELVLKVAKYLVLYNGRTWERVGNFTWALISPTRSGKPRTVALPYCQAMPSTYHRFSVKALQKCYYI